MWRSVKVLWCSWLIFFSRTGSLTDIGRKFLFRTFHTSCPCVWPSTPWMSKPVRIFIIPVVQWGYSTSTFWFFSNLRFFLKYWSGSILYIGRLCLASDKTLYIFFFTFHIDDSGMRKCEVQQRDGWKSTINWLCTPSEKGNKHYLLSWVTSKE